MQLPMKNYHPGSLMRRHAVEYRDTWFLEITNIVIPLSLVFQLEVHET
jgi:hypothetical protein